MSKKKENREGARLAMACPFCDEPAIVKACKGDGRGAAGQDWYWRCGCGSRGFFPDAHFKALDKLKKISIAS